MLIKIYSILTIIIGVFSALFALVYGYEAFSVQMNDTYYNWGTEEPLSWNYENRETYLASALFNALLLSLLALFILYGYIKKSLKAYYISWVLLVFIIFTHQTGLAKSFILYLVQ